MKYSKKTLYLMENLGNTKQEIFNKRNRVGHKIRGKQKWLRENTNVSCQQ